MKLDNRIKKVLVILLTALLVFNTLFFSYKKAEATALGIGLGAFVLGLLGAYGVSCIWSGNDSSAYNEDCILLINSFIVSSFATVSSKLFKLFNNSFTCN